MPSTKFDGISFVPALSGGKLPARTLVTDTQRVELLTKYKEPCVMTDRWRLVNQQELYDIQIDPGQESDVAGQFPEVLKQLQSDYETWLAEVSADADKYDRIILGNINVIRIWQAAINSP